MNLQDAEELACKLIAEWLPAYWRFAWSNTKNSNGDCDYDTTTIRLSRIRTAANPCETVENTIRHEIAHALAGWKAGHGPDWKHYATVVGADPNRISHGRAVGEIAYKWVAACPSCRKTTRKHRLSKDMAEGNWSCGPCCRQYSGGRWDERFRLTFVQQW